MDFHCIEAFLNLPEFRIIQQVVSSQELTLHLERRDTAIICPRCRTSCSRVKERRPRCLRDLPIRERPVMRVLPTSLRETRFSMAYSHPY